MNGALGDVVRLLVSSLGGLYILMVLLRFLLQAARADFYNPVCQAIVKLTGPVVTPFRRIIPGWRGLDFATLVVALLLNSVATWLLLMTAGFSAPITLIVSWSAVGLMAYILNIYFFAVLISVIVSFVAPFSAHPVVLLLHQLLEPVYRPLRRIMPAMGGLDFSPLFIFLGINVLEIMVIGPLASGLQLAPDFVLGIR